MFGAILLSLFDFFIPYLITLIFKIWFIFFCFGFMYLSGLFVSFFIRTRKKWNSWKKEERKNLFDHINNDDDDDYVNQTIQYFIYDNNNKNETLNFDPWIQNDNTTMMMFDIIIIKSVLLPWSSSSSFFLGWWWQIK